MEGKLIFCSDAILRFQSDYDETSAVPLLSIQNTIANTDPFFLLRFFHHTVLKWFTEFGHLNRGDMLTSEQHRCHNEKKKFQR
ncbi:hypothetical protein ACNJOX_24705, partial [Escherichia coli]